MSDPLSHEGGKFEFVEGGEPLWVSSFTPSTDILYELGGIPENDPHWHCELYGCGPNGMIWYPPKGHVPNWFWRKMQWLILGNKWVYKA